MLLQLPGGERAEEAGEEVGTNPTSVEVAPEMNLQPCATACRYNVVLKVGGGLHTYIHTYIH